MAHTETDTAGRRFTTVAEGGPLGPGRLFQDPSLATLDKLIEAQRDLPTTAGRRGAGEAFQNFSAFLDLQDRRKSSRQLQQLRFKAAEQDLEKRRLGNVARQKAIEQSTRPITSDLIQLSSQPREQFLAGMSQLRQQGVRLKPDDLINLNRANLQQVAQNRLAETEARQQDTAAGKSRTARSAEDVAILEEQIQRPLTRSEKIQMLDPTSRTVLLTQLSQEAAGAGPGAREVSEEAAPFTQAPEQAEGAGQVVTEAQARQIRLENPQITTAEQLDEEILRRGFRLP